jgi:hypothetical protein
MTDRHSAYLITLDHDIREDDSAEIISAIRMIRFVTSVQPVTADIPVQVAQSRRDALWREKLTELAIHGPGELKCPGKYNS